VCVILAGSRVFIIQASDTNQTQVTIRMLIVTSEIYYNIYHVYGLNILVQSD